MKKKIIYNKKRKKKNLSRKFGHSYCINCIVAGCWLAGRWLSPRGVRVGRARQAGMLGARGARRRHGRWAARARALERAGAQQQARRACVGARTGAGAGARQGAGGRRAGRAQQWRGRRAAWALGARPGRWARGLGAWAGLGQCTRCTRPIFDPF